MKVKDVNLTNINETNIDFYIAPSNDWHLGETNFNILSLNFTWNVTEYLQNYMKIKLTFNNPLEISPKSK